MERSRCLLMRSGKEKQERNTFQHGTNLKDVAKRGSCGSRAGATPLREEWAHGRGTVGSSSMKLKKWGALRQPHFDKQIEMLKDRTDERSCGRCRWRASRLP